MTLNNTKPLLGSFMAFAILAGGASIAGESEWRIYSEESKGDVYFYDASRVETASDLRTVWTRIRYKNSVMGAYSYQGLLEVNCTQRTVRTLQRTFFSDSDWEKPAMKTDMKAKQKRRIKEGSASARLSAILCAP